MKEPGKQWIVRLLLSALMLVLAAGLFTNAALAEDYPIWVGGIHVTSDNQNDILGDGGKAVYDPATLTLTLNDPALTGAYNGAQILVENQNLRLVGSAVLNAPCPYGIYASGTAELTLEGDFTVNVGSLSQAIVSDGNLTITGGTIQANAVTDQAIYAGGSILIQGGNVKAYTNASVGIEAANNINIMDGQVDAKGEKGISASFIALDGGSVTATGEGSTGIGIFADGLVISNNITQVTGSGMAASIAATSALTIEDSLSIITPEEGVQAKVSVGHTICKADGVSIATQATITQAYPLWVGNVRVTGINKNDILNDGGTAVYDPSTDILTLNSPNIPSTHNNTKIFYESTGTLALKGNAVLTDAIYGVYAQTGSLTIAGDFTADNVSVGISAKEDIWVNSGTMNIKASSYGLRGDSVSLKNCKVTASGKTAIQGFSSLNINADVTAVGDDYGIGGYGCASLTISGGNIQADGGSSGIQADSIHFSGGTITASSAVDGVFCKTGQIDGNTNLTCTGAENGFRFYTSLMIEGDAVQASSSGGNGIYGSSGSAYLIMNGGSITASGPSKGILSANIIIGNGVETVTADSASNAVLANNLTIGDKKYITEPYGGINTGTTIVEANGSTVATHAVISSDKLYPVWVGSVQVKESNKNDVLGDGKVSYDPVESRLTLNDPSIPDTFADSVIYAENLNLIVEGSASLPSAKYGIRVLKGKLTLTDASISAEGIEYEGLYAVGITIQDSKMNLSSDSVAIFSDENVTILDSTVTAVGKLHAIVTVGNVNMSGDITLEGGETAVLTGVFSGHSTVSIGSGSVKSVGAMVACDDFGIWSGTVWVDGASNGAAYGILSKNGGVYIFDEVSQVTAIGTEGAILGASLTIADNLGVAVPQNGINDGKQIVEADGVTVATTAVISPLLTVTLEPGEGSGSPIVLGKYPKNATIDLPPFPAEWQEPEGKHFTDWQVDNGIFTQRYNVNSSMKITIINDTTLTALYYYWITGWEETNGNYAAVDSVNDSGQEIPQKNAKNRMFGDDVFIDIYLKDGYMLLDNAVEVLASSGTLLKQYTFTYDGTRYYFTFENPKQDVSLRFTVDDGIETPSYIFTKGDGAEWVKQSGVPLDFTVKAVGEDKDTFRKFTGIQIDGAIVPLANYTATAGSVNLSLKQDFLEQLALGTHTIHAAFTDGEAQAEFIVKDALEPIMTATPIIITNTPMPIDDTNTPTPGQPTASPTRRPRPTAAPVDPDPGYSYRFHFTKQWLGDREDSIQWTLYNSNGVPVSKKFNKRIINENEWVYEAWFSYDASDFYLVETAPDGYMVRYENTGDHAQVTDRCYNGGTITNYKLPKTGDSMPLELIIGWILVGISTVTIALVKKSRKGKA